MGVRNRIWDVEGPGLWLRRKDKAGTCPGKGPASCTRARIPKAQTSKQLGELTSNDSPRSLKEQNSPTVHVGNGACFWKEALDGTRRLGDIWKEAFSPKRGEGVMRRRQGTRRSS